MVLSNSGFGVGYLGVDVLQAELVEGERQPESDNELDSVLLCRFAFVIGFELVLLALDFGVLGGLPV